MTSPEALMRFTTMSDHGQARPAGAMADMDDILRGILDGLPLRAGSFIVTIYGDVVEPRGGRLWIGNIIETCATVGISETLVRTAVSRLVGAGQLLGEREGRRSYYRLTQTAQQQFGGAAERLFDGAPLSGWMFVWLPPFAEGGALACEAAGLARISNGGAAGSWFIGPAQTLPDDIGLVTFAATTDAQHRLIRALAEGHWDLDSHAAAYQAFETRFLPLMNTIDAGAQPSSMQSLLLRLLLVHSYRHVALRDPMLPPEALPSDWRGYSARGLFARLYGALSPAADTFVAATFVSAEGALPASTPSTDRRLTALGNTATLSPH